MVNTKDIGNFSDDDTILTSKKDKKPELFVENLSYLKFERGIWIEIYSIEKDKFMVQTFMLSKNKKKQNIEENDLDLDPEALMEKFKNTILYEIYTNSFSVNNII